MKNYGLQIYRSGVVLHEDGRRFGWGRDGFGPRKRSSRARGRRRRVAAWSQSSQRRLEFIAANCAAEFKTFITLTYHALVASWEDKDGRNRRIARRTKKDLNRFLCHLRGELGEHLWVQEFQERGVVHYHLLCEGEPSRDRCSEVWLRATGEWRDEAAARHAVKVEHVKAERGVRGYLGKYLGKGRQKFLPEGLEGAGRWWGRSRGLKLELLREIVTHFPEGGNMRQEAVCLRRSFRRWFSGDLGRHARSGVFIEWRGERSARAVGVVDELVRFYLREISGVTV